MNSKGLLWLSLLWEITVTGSSLVSLLQAWGSAEAKAEVSENAPEPLSVQNEGKAMGGASD